MAKARNRGLAAEILKRGKALAPGTLISSAILANEMGLTTTGVSAAFSYLEAGARRACGSRNVPHH